MIPGSMETMQDAVRDLLKGAKQTNEAAEQFCAEVERNVASPEAMEDVLVAGWKEIIDQAASHSYTSPDTRNLLDLMTQIQNQPDIKTQDGQAATVQDMKFWSDLPMFGWGVRDAWNSAANDSSPQGRKEEWINLNAFIASLTQAIHLKASDNPDLSLFCIWTLRTGLEENDTSYSETSVAAAAVWIVLAAPTILDFCKNEKSFDGKVARGGGEYREREWKGFSSERWQIWRKVLEGARGEVKGDPKDQIEKALKRMSEAESG